MKFFTFLLVILLGCKMPSLAQTNGCNLGAVIHTTYLGQTVFYGTTFQVYSKNGYKLTIYNNPGAAPCDQIKKSSYNATGINCWVADRVPPTNNQTNSDGSNVSYASSDGIVTFAANSYTKCTVNTPLDRYTIYFSVILGLLSAYYLRKQVTLNANPL